MRELLARPVLAQNLVPAEQVRRVIRLLKLVAVPREPQANLGLHLVAGRAHAGRGLHVLPGTELREDVFKAVEGVFNSVLGFELPRAHMPDPLAVQWVHGEDDGLVQMLNFAADVTAESLTTYHKFTFGCKILCASTMLVRI